MMGHPRAIFRSYLAIDCCTVINDYTQQVLVADVVVDESVIPRDVLASAAVKSGLLGREVSEQAPSWWRCLWCLVLLSFFFYIIPDFGWIVLLRCSVAAASAAAAAAAAAISSDRHTLRLSRLLCAYIGGFGSVRTLCACPEPF